jgi:uncharacterized membrane protein YjfL (UPF0719 family)
MEPWLETLLQHLAAAAVFTALGVVLFLAALWTMARITPFSIRKEIAEDQNTALAIVMGSVFLGLALIVAAAITG